MAGDPRRSERPHRREKVSTRPSGSSRTRCACGNVNFVCLWIDSAGGPPEECLGLAEFLRRPRSGGGAHRGLYPRQGPRQAALVAMACDQIVMHPEAVLGGPGSPQMSHDEIEVAKQTIRKRLAPRRLRSWSLWAAMIDPHDRGLSLHAAGRREFFSGRNSPAEAKPDVGGNGPPWQQGPVRHHAVRGLRRGTQAVDLRLANHMVESFADFKRRYHLEDDPTLVGAGLGRPAGRLPQQVRACRPCC